MGEQNFASVQTNDRAQIDPFFRSVLSSFPKKTDLRDERVKDDEAGICWDGRLGLLRREDQEFLFIFFRFYYGLFLLLGL